MCEQFSLPIEDAWWKASDTDDWRPAPGVTAHQPDSSLALGGFCEES